MKKIESPKTKGRHSWTPGSFGKHGFRGHFAIYISPKKLCLPNLPGVQPRFVLNRKLIVNYCEQNIFNLKIRPQIIPRNREVHAQK